MANSANSNRISIAHISLARGYKGNERQTELLIKELANLGVPQVLVCRDNSPLPMHLTGTKNLKVIRIGGMTDPRLMGHFRLGKQCTILQAHEAHAMQWCLVHYLMCGTPYVLTLRKDDPERNNFVNRAMFHNAAAVVGISKVIKTNFEKTFERQCYVIGDCASHLQANPDMVHRFRQAFKNRFVVGNVGALINRQNGQSVLIDAAKILKTKIPELVIVLVGAGDDSGLLKAHAEGMPNIKFVGFRRNFLDYIASFDAFAYPVNNAGTGSIILDVMEQGVPVIASNVGGITDLVQHGQSGLLIRPGDANMMADHILALKRNPALRKNLVQNAYNVVDDHSSANMAASYYRIYTSIVQQSRI